MTDTAASTRVGKASKSKKRGSKTSKKSKSDSRKSQKAVKNNDTLVVASVIDDDHVPLVNVDSGTFPGNLSFNGNQVLHRQQYFEHYDDYYFNEEDANQRWSTSNGNFVNGSHSSRLSKFVDSDDEQPIILNYSFPKNNDFYDIDELTAVALDDHIHEKIPLATRRKSLALMKYTNQDEEDELPLAQVQLKRMAETTSEDDDTLKGMNEDTAHSDTADHGSHDEGGEEEDELLFQLAEAANLHHDQHHIDHAIPIITITTPEDKDYIVEDMDDLGQLSIKHVPKPEPELEMLEVPSIAMDENPQLTDEDESSEEEEENLEFTSNKFALVRGTLLDSYDLDQQRKRETQTAVMTAIYRDQEWRMSILGASKRSMSLEILNGQLDFEPKPEVTPSIEQETPQIPDNVPPVDKQPQETRKQYLNRIQNVSKAAFRGRLMELGLTFISTLLLISMLFSPFWISWKITNGGSFRVGEHFTIGPGLGVYCNGSCIFISAISVPSTNPLAENTFNNTNPYERFFDQPMWTEYLASQWLMVIACGFGLLAFGLQVSFFRRRKLLFRNIHENCRVELWIFFALFLVLVSILSFVVVGLMAGIKNAALRVALDKSAYNIASQNISIVSEWSAYVAVVPGLLFMFRLIILPSSLARERREIEKANLKKNKKKSAAEKV